MTTFSILVLRSIVAKTFKISPRAITLRGALAPDASWQNVSHDGSLGSSSYTVKIWGWSPDTGFENLSFCVGNRSGSNYAHSQSYDTSGTALHDVAGSDQYAFFLVKTMDYSNWSGSEYRDETGWELYPAPNFAAHRDALEAADVSRWENWYTSLAGEGVPA